MESELNPVGRLREFKPNNLRRCGSEKSSKYTSVQVGEGMVLVVVVDWVPKVEVAVKVANAEVEVTTP
jgi:hypothetical protein